MSSSALLPSPAVSPQSQLPWARAPVISNQEIPPRQQCLTHLYTVTFQCHQQIAFAVQKATFESPYSQRTEGSLRTDGWTLLHRPCLQSPRVVTHGKFTGNIFSLNWTIYTGDVCIKGWNASYSCPAQKQVESSFFKTVQSFDTDCYNHKDSSKSLNRKFLLEQ